MIVAVASSGESFSDLIDSRFGRCSYFIIVEIHDNIIKSVRAVRNTAQDVDRGAGVIASQLIINQGADTLIARKVGPKALSILLKFGIKVLTADGIVEHAIKKLINNELTEINYE